MGPKVPTIDTRTMQLSPMPDEIVAIMWNRLTSFLNMSRQVPDVLLFASLPLHLFNDFREEKEDLQVAQVELFVLRRPEALAQFE